MGGRKAKYNGIHLVLIENLRGAIFVQHNSDHERIHRPNQSNELEAEARLIDYALLLTIFIQKNNLSKR